MHEPGEGQEKERKETSTKMIIYIYIRWNELLSSRSAFNRPLRDVDIHSQDLLCPQFTDVSCSPTYHSQLGEITFVVFGRLSPIITCQSQQYQTVGIGPQYRRECVTFFSL